MLDLAPSHFCCYQFLLPMTTHEHIISTSTREVEQIIRLDVAFKVEGCRNEETLSLLFLLLCRDTLDVTLRED